MQAIGFYLLYPFLYLLSLLPFPVFYLVSDLVFLLLYHVLGYRKKVVLQNLRNSFPEKNDAEISRLAVTFYKYFCDMSLEILKTLTISKEEMLKRCTMEEASLRLMNKYHDEKQSIILVLGHLGNWEWGGNAFSLQCKQPLYVIYHPLQNRYVNGMVNGMRTRFGTRLIQMKHTFRDMIANIKEVNATAFIADQSPPPESAYWTRFLNQDTAIFQGTEKIARKLNHPVVFMTVKKTGRGYYELLAETLCEQPSATRDGEISELHTNKLESEIRKQPEAWLWTHKRWKNKRPLPR